MVRKDVAQSARLSIAGCIVMWVGACAPASDGVTPLPDTTTSVSTTPTQERGERDAVVDAYVRFWPRLHEVAGQPESRWAELMGEVAIDPQLTRTLDALRQQRAQSRTLYGSETARVTTVDVSGGQATVTDCQDASQAGQADAATGDRKTVGVARNPVSATLVRGSDLLWRVSEISYPGGTC